MSYILDALKRAEAERERGQVPGLHAQTLTPPLATPPDGKFRTWHALAMLAALAALGGAVWYLKMAPSQGATTAVALSTQPAPVPPQAPTPAPVATTVPAAASATAPTATATATATAVPAAAPATTRSPKPAPKAAPTAASVTKAPVPAVVRDATPPVAKPAPTPAAPPPPTVAPTAAPSPLPPPAQVQVPSLNALPDGLRASIPKLALSGSVYSSNPRQRMLIVNGQVINEGGLAAPEVTLERIGPTSAVLSFRGTQFSVQY